MYIRSVQTTSTPKGEQADRLTGEQSSRLTDFKPFRLQAFLPNPETPKAFKPRNAEGIETALAIQTAQPLKLSNGRSPSNAAGIET